LFAISLDALATWTPAAAVFDCDGLLMDTEPCWVDAEAAVFASRGLVFDAVLRAQFIGRSMHVNAAEMARLFDEPGNEPAILDEVHEGVVTRIRDGARPLPGALAAVERAAACMPVAVATNSPRFILEAALERGGLRDAFAISVSLDDVDNPKPHPEIYLTICERLGVEPAGSLAFEDSLTGLASARAAGMRVIGVPTLEHADGEFDADHVFGSLADGELACWMAGWPASR
jgi:HAD superfamily hydrolase (TIGR01509 family)